VSEVRGGTGTGAGGGELHRQGLLGRERIFQMKFLRQFLAFGVASLASLLLVIYLLLACAASTLDPATFAFTDFVTDRGDDSDNDDWTDYGF
jgi:hypothetical protein